jgi:hypothetical protein
VAPRVLYEV